MEETLACFCNACSKELGQFRNAWSVIGNNYFTPVYPMLSFGHGFIGTGDVRASKLGDLETCFLQNLNCKYCQVFLGIRCDSAPTSHILKRHQLLLRLSEITTLVAGTNQKAQISIKNAFILESADSTAAKRPKSRAPSIGPGPSRSKSMSAQPTHSTPSQSLHSLQSVQQPRSSQTSHHVQPPTNAMSIQPPQSRPVRSSQSGPSQVSTFKHNDAMPPPSQQEDTSSSSPALLATSAFEVWAEKEIKDHRNDINRISSSVDRIEKTMEDITEFMAAVGGQQITDQEFQKQTVSARQLLHTGITNLGARVDAFGPKLASHSNSISLLNANSATKGNVSHVLNLVEATGQREANDVSAIMEQLRDMSAKIGSTSETGWEALRTELNTVKTKLALMEASTRIMRSEAVTAETSRLRNEADLYNKISKLMPSSRTEVIPMQRALELAGPSGSHESYEEWNATLREGRDAALRPVLRPPGIGALSYLNHHRVNTSRPVYENLQPADNKPRNIARKPPREHVDLSSQVGNASMNGLQRNPTEPTVATSNQKSLLQPSERVPIQRALELAGMVDQNSTPPYSTPYPAIPPRSNYEKIKEKSLVKPAVVQESSTDGTNNLVMPQSLQDDVLVNNNTHSFVEASPVEKGVSTKGTAPRSKSPFTTFPAGFKKSIIRVEIGPLNLDEFPPIKNEGEINSAALSSPDTSDSESSDVSSIPAIAKQKQIEPGFDHKGKGRALSLSRKPQTKRRKVSASAADTISRLESPELEPARDIIEIGSSDEDRSPDLFVNKNAIQSIETQDTGSQVPLLDQGTREVLSILNRVAKQPFRSSFDTQTNQAGNPNAQNSIMNLPTQTQDPRPHYSKPTDANGDMLRNYGGVDRRSIRRQSSMQDNDSTSSGGKERLTRPASGASLRNFRSHVQDFTAPTPPSHKSRKALEQARRDDSPLDTPMNRGLEDASIDYHNPRQEVHQEQSMATPEQAENPFKCGVCNRRFDRSAGLKNHKNFNLACKADSSRDEVPSEFICSGCERSYSSLHLFNMHKCSSFATPAEMAET